MKKQPWEERMDALDKRLDRIVSIQEGTARRIDAISKLMQIGARHLIKMEEAQRLFFENITKANGHKKR